MEEYVYSSVPEFLEVQITTWKEEVQATELQLQRLEDRGTHLRKVADTLDELIAWAEQELLLERRLDRSRAHRNHAFIVKIAQTPDS